MAAPVVTMQQLIEAGAHFGHQTHRWNPRMKPYIFGARNGIYIIDLQQTVRLFKEAYGFVRDLAAEGGTVLFVGTKKQAQDAIREEAERCGMFHVTNRWLGGMLTNFQTIKQSIDRLKKLEEMLEDSQVAQALTKKEMGGMRHEREKLERNLGGIQALERLPDAVFVIDTKKEHIAVTEARKLGIPVIAIVDTNCDPDEVDYVIPGNDDAIRAVNLVSRVIANELAAGYGMAKEEVVQRATGMPRPSGAKPQAAPAAVDETPSHEEAAAIASSTVFEPDIPSAEEPEIEIELEPGAEATAEPAAEPAAEGSPSTGEAAQPDAEAPTEPPSDEERAVAEVGAEPAASSQES